MTDRPRPYLIGRWVRIGGKAREPLLFVLDDPTGPSGVAYWRITDLETGDRGRVREPSPISQAPPLRVFTRCKSSGYAREPRERRAVQLHPDDERGYLTEAVMQ